MSGHDIGVKAECHGPVEDSVDVLSRERRISSPVGRPLPHAVGGLVGHQDPRHPWVPGAGVVVVLPVQVGKMEEDSRGT